MGRFRTDLLGARLAFTDRHGGVSRAPFDTLNLSSVEGDDEAAVARNRDIAAMQLGDADASGWLPLRQVHGADVAVVHDPASRAPDGEPRAADAVVVIEPGSVGAVLTADCAPLGLVAAGGVAAVHGGWRGLAAGIVERAVEVLQAEGGPVRHAVLGPCIRSCCYEFGEVDLAELEGTFGPEIRATTTRGAPALDLPVVVARALARAGVGVPLVDLAVCTCCSSDYFSFRREGRTGRQGLLVTVPARDGQQ